MTAVIPPRVGAGVDWEGGRVVRAGEVSGRMYLEYYSDPHVRARILDFLGGRSLHATTCVYLTTRGPGDEVPRAIAPEGLWASLLQDTEVERSLWDREALVADLDLEYVHFDSPLMPYLDPVRAFNLQRPVVQAIQTVLLEDGVAPLHLLSGRGHHFAWRVRRDSRAFWRLARLGQPWLDESMLREYGLACPPAEEAVGGEAGAAYAGLGLVMELVAHRVIREVDSRCRVPLQVTAVEVGPGPRGREIVSLDLSEYADPLHRRTVRVPFGAYLKADLWAARVAPSQIGELPPAVVLPLHEMAESEGLAVMRDLEAAAELARRAPTGIPDVSREMDALIDRYEASSLRVFHRWFLEGADEPTGLPEGLPPCMRALVEQPNDRLLRPAAMQLLVRWLLGEGWHPRAIACVIRGAFLEEHGWRPGVHFWNADSRAVFYTRLFAGLFAAGLDELIDFNCRSTQEKGYCPRMDCGSNLALGRDRLRERRSHGRLAGRPVHGVLLQDQPL